VRQALASSLARSDDAERLNTACDVQLQSNSRGPWARMKEGTTLEPVLELTSISKAFGGVAALRGVSLSLFPGEVHALVGENGAGKSTLVNIISGAVSPDDGTVNVSGDEHAGLTATQALRAGIVTVHQEFTLLPELTVAENIALAVPVPWFRPISWRRLRRRARDLLEHVGAVGISPRDLVRDLTVAQQQLVEIAKALALDARVLILDEPTAVLNENETEQLFELVRKLAGAGTAVLFISHRLDEIFGLADRITVLRDGAHISTTPATHTNPSRLVEAMVGRKLQEQYPPRSHEVGETRLVVENLTVGKVLREVNIEARAGEVVGLAGLGGSGRTTTCEAVVGLVPRARGTVQVNGRVLAGNLRMSAAAGVVLVPEDRKRHGVFVDRSLAFNLTLLTDGGSTSGFRSQGSDHRSALALIEKFGIKAASTTVNVGNLSGGNQQKVVLAKWLSREPSVVLLDEPTRGIDVGAKRTIYDLVNAIAARGTSVIVASSELAELLGITDRIYVFFEGSVVRELVTSSTTQEEIIHYASGLK
jgi:ABC-type sugar transport system ATPase subunit